LFHLRPQLMKRRIIFSVRVLFALSTAGVNLSLGTGGLGTTSGATKISLASQDLGPSTSRSIYLVIEDSLLEALQGGLPSLFRVQRESDLNPSVILQAVARGDSLVWIGNGAALPEELWVGIFRPASSPLVPTSAKRSPLDLSSLAFRQSVSYSAFIKPNKEMPYHNIDEEPRAELLPLLESRDRFGQVVGYPAVLMHYFAPSTVKHRFGGSECFFFLFDRPMEALDPKGWLDLLERIGTRFQAGVQLTRVETDYASYRVGERVQIRARVTNQRARAVAVEIRFAIKAPDQREFQMFAKHRRVPDDGSPSEAISGFRLGGRQGLWTIRVEVWQDPAHAEELAVEGHPRLVDRRELGFVVLNGLIQTPPIVSLNGPNIRIDGQDNFWVGTNYYPSSSWWDWLWSDFRPLAVASDFAAMRRSGYRIVRIWIDPVLDERTLRAMDAAVFLAWQNGIVLDVCVFTQWVRTIGFQRPNGEQVLFDFRGMRDFNIYGISLRNLPLQREYIQVLATRWRGAGNIIYNLSNETYLRDPDSTQMDKEVTQWEGIPRQNGILRDTLLFRRWAKEMTNIIRQVGGKQPVMPGYMFSMLGGGDDYLANRDGELESWHHYASPESIGLTLSYVDSACSERSLVLEEFGARSWNNEKFYDGGAHYALAAGAAAAMSYEWGIRWLSQELDFSATPLREILDLTPTDPRWFLPVRDLVKHWSSRAVGLHPAPSGFTYGSIYHGTPFPAAAAIALGRLGLVGRGLGRAVRPEKVYVVVPTAFKGDRDGLEEVTQTVKKLWQEKAVFGIWQEDCLNSLPTSARVLICPKGVTAASEGRLAELRRSAVEVFIGADNGWQRSPQVPHVSVTPSEGMDLLVRRTHQGTLYGLMRTGGPGTVRLRTEGKRVVSLGVEPYAFVLDRGTGIGLVEAAGEVSIDGFFFCRVERGRAWVVSDEQADLKGAKVVRVLVTEPMKIQFARTIAAISVLEEGRSEPLARLIPGGSDPRVLEVDSEVARSVLRVEFK